jgi:adenylate cyclase
MRSWNNVILTTCARRASSEYGSITARWVLERKLTAILCADVFGYSRLMGDDEEATLLTLSSHRKLIDSLIEQHHGRFVNSAGDSVLAEFASVVNAVQCAVEIQTTLKTENAPLPPERRMEFRIGVNLGDVMVDGEQIYGDGVNVVARLESLAEPGGICVSGTVREHLGNRLVLSYEDLGEQLVKNIAKPVRVFRVLMEAGGAATPARQIQGVARKYVRRGIFSIAGLAIIAATIIFVQHLSLRPPTPSASIPPAQPPALPLPDKPSIAVLPFTNMSGDRDQEYFSDGITDDLITALSRLPDLFVIARTSTFTYKGKAAKVQDIGRELGVAYVLEGSVRKEASQVRITAQLVDATTGDHLWAEHYDRPLKDIFSLQDEIVHRIVTTLNLRLDAMQQGFDVPQTTGNLEAYDDYLRGYGYFWSLNKDDNEKAREMLERAIALDPKYSDAYALLAYVFEFDWLFQWSRDPHRLDQMSQAAQQAITLDDSSAFAFTALSQAYLLKLEYDKSITAAQRAVAIDHNFALGYDALAYALEMSGRPAEALGASEKAMRLDPRNRAYLLHEGYAYALMGRCERAVPVLKVYLDRYPNYLTAHYWLAACYVELGRIDDARAEAAEVLRINPGFSLEKQKQVYVLVKEPMRDRLFGDMAKAGLK